MSFQSFRLHLTRITSFIFPFLVIFFCYGCSIDKKKPFTIEVAKKLKVPFHSVLSPNGKKVAYSRGDSLYVIGTNGSDEPKSISSGLRSQSSYAEPYMAWRPDGNKLLFRAGEDELMVANLKDFSVNQLLSDSLSKNIQTFSNFLAGGPSWSPDGKEIALLARLPDQNSTGLQVYIFNTETKKLEAWTSTNDGVLSTTWSPDGRWLAYSTGSFSGQSGAIYLLDSKDKDKKMTVIEGNSAAYRELLWSKDGQKLFTRNRSGKPIIFKVNEDGKSEKISTSLTSRTYNGWLKNGNALLTSVSDGLSRRLAVMNIKSGKTTYLTGVDTLARAVGAVSQEKDDLIVFTTESGNMPRKIFAAEIIGHDSKQLSSSRSLTPLPSILDSVKLAKHQIFKWQPQTGDTLDSQLFLPNNLDSKPPLVVIPYGGYTNEFPDSDYFLSQGIQVLADRGYAVVLPNTRGIASESQQNNDYGVPQLSDTQALIKALGNAELADTSKVAVMGHSHGGAMVYYYITHSSSFDAAVAINGAADWIEQAKLRRMSGLPFGMGGMPKEYPDKYESYSPIENIEKVQIPLLAIAGRNDSQIPPSINAIKMVDTLQAVNKDATLHIFEDEGHLIEKPNNQNLFWEKVIVFLDRTIGNNR